MTADVFVETDCTFSHDGQTYEAGGAVVTADAALVYAGQDLRHVTDWQGRRLGTMRVVSSWTNTLTGYRMRAVRVTLDDGRRYHGRYGSDWSQLIRLRRVTADA